MPHYIQKQSTGLTDKLFLLLGKMLQDHAARAKECIREIAMGAPTENPDIFLPGME